MKTNHRARPRIPTDSPPEPDHHPDNEGDGPVVADVDIQTVDFMALIADDWDAPSPAGPPLPEPKPDVCIDDVIAEGEDNVSLPRKPELP
jgi:hypothetical protein